MGEGDMEKRKADLLADLLLSRVFLALGPCWRHAGHDGDQCGNTRALTGCFQQNWACVAAGHQFSKATRPAG